MSKKTAKKTTTKKATRKKRKTRTQLTPEIVDKAVEVVAKGFSDQEVADFLGISFMTWKGWKDRYPEFREAIEEIAEPRALLIERTMQMTAMGFWKTFKRPIIYKGEITGYYEEEKYYPPNVAAQKFLLMNLQPSKWSERYQLNPPEPILSETPVTFEEFCKNAGYPKPYPKQVEMVKFGMYEPDPHLILGSRGYGKTDYVVIMGLAYRIYRDRQFTALLVTKSEERNSAIIAEIGKALRANGVRIDKENAGCLRVASLMGKDHSISAVTVGTSSIRGRHPKIIVMDDPVTPEDTSEATRKRVRRIYDELTKLCKSILIIGQPVHKFDLYESLRPTLKKMEVPHGTIPELDHDLEAQRLAGVSEESIQASYFLKVVSENSNPLENVKFIKTFPPGDSVAFIDPSFEGGDYTALSIVKAHFEGVAVKGRVYKKAWYDCLTEMAAEMQRCGVKKVCFETNSLGDQPVVMLRDILDGVGVVGKKSTGHKHSRIVAAGAFAHLIHIAQDSDSKYIEQVTKYEYGTDFDDAPDSLASALEWIGLIRGKVK